VKRQKTGVVMERRRFVACASAVALARPASAQEVDTLPVPPSGRMAFKVFRNGAAVGEHHLNFTQNDDALVVEINIDLVVTLAGIVMFRYSTAAVERWLGGVFQSLDSQVNENGALLEVHAKKVAAGYDVVGINHANPAKSYPEYIAPPNTMPLTYWNKAMLNAHILNIQTAHSYPAIVTSPGWDNLPTAEGGLLLAQRFDVTGKLHLSVWYDQMAQWSGLQFNYLGEISYEKFMS